MAEERTTEEEKLHIMEGKSITFVSIITNTHRITFFFPARRRVAAKRKKLKNLGKSKSTDTEDEDVDEDCGDEGEYFLHFFYLSICRTFNFSGEKLHQIKRDLEIAVRLSNVEIEKYCQYANSDNLIYLQLIKPKRVKLKKKVRKQK